MFGLGEWIGLPDGGRYFEVSLEDGRIVLTPLRLGDSEQAREWTAELLRIAEAWLESNASPVWSLLKHGPPIRMDAEALVLSREFVGRLILVTETQGNLASTL